MLLAGKDRLQFLSKSYIPDEPTKTCHTDPKSGTIQEQNSTKT